MHTPVEVVSLADLEAAAKLLAATVATINRRTTFIPE
jgi:putative aminopeptidase FrvX